MKINDGNEFLEFVEHGEDVPNAIEPKERTNTYALLKAKYPRCPIPTHRRIRTISDKQRRALALK